MFAVTVDLMATSRSRSPIRIIVLGALNTDIIAIGVAHLPRAGEDVYASELRIGPGGKARNVANMIAVITGRESVAMLSRTSKDPFDLWKPPLEALEAVGVNTDYVFMANYAEGGVSPGIALVAVDTVGNRHASISNTILDHFTTADIDRAQKLFKTAARNDGLLVLTLEVPIETAAYAIRLAASLGIKVILDPGGLRHNANLNDILSQEIYILKPNEFEARQLSGIQVTDYESAKRAADKLRERGTQNVLITHGAHGGYLFGRDTAQHISIPPHATVGQTDATGCGDQVTATLCAYLSEGLTLSASAKLSIVAGTLQFHRIGVQPVTRGDIESLAADLNDHVSSDTEHDE